MGIEFPDISSDEQHRIIETGFEFLQALIAAYGDGRATEIWETFTVAVDPNIHREMLIAMLKGNGNIGKTFSLNGINLMTTGSNGHSSGLIDTIKAIRAVTGMGLREAKDLAEDVRDNGPRRARMIESITRTEAMRIFRDAGCDAT